MTPKPLTRKEWESGLWGQPGRLSVTVDALFAFKEMALNENLECGMECGGRNLKDIAKELGLE